jgi:hypothetical protein
MVTFTWYTQHHRTSTPSVTIGTKVITFNHAMQPIIGTATHADIGTRNHKRGIHLGFRFSNNGRYKINKTSTTWSMARPKALTIPPARQLPIAQEGTISYATIPKAEDVMGRVAVGKIQSTH